MAIPDSRWFCYQSQELYCDGVPLREIAEQVDTPAFVYAGRAIDEAYDAIDEALSFVPHLIAYAIKANGNLSLLARLASRGCGADIVSAGELARALKAGFPPERIVFSGVGKRPHEILAAVEAGVRALHIENAEEAELIDQASKKVGKPVSVAVRINPDVDPDTHPYVATGLQQSKFGLSVPAARSLIEALIDHPRVRLEGLAMHIGSQLSSVLPLQEAIEILGRFASECIDRGVALRSIDIGGGWPMNYGNEVKPYPPVADFGEAISTGLSASGLLERDLEIITEPGRALVGDAGVLLSRVLYTKDQGARRFAIVDAAMTELIRPALYGAYHAIMAVQEPGEEKQTVDVVGPVCESGDFIAQDRDLPPLKSGDLIAIRGAGAYAREMGSMYNARPFPPEVLVESGKTRVIRSRGDESSLWLHEDF